MKKAFKVEYGRIPNTVSYCCAISTVYLADNPDEAPPTEDVLSNITFVDVPFETIVSALHDLLSRHPDYSVLIAPGKVTGRTLLVEEGTGTLLADNVRDMIRDDIEKALDYWAPTSRTVHVRGKETQNA